VYEAFERRWEVGRGVYWQMRWKEVVGGVEGALGAGVGGSLTQGTGECVLKRLEKCD
jgi:hypothetical protein